MKINCFVSVSDEQCQVNCFVEWNLYDRCMTLYVMSNFRQENYKHQSACMTTGCPPIEEVTFCIGKPLQGVPRVKSDVPLWSRLVGTDKGILKGKVFNAPAPPSPSYRLRLIHPHHPSICQCQRSVKARVTMRGTGLKRS